MNRRKVWAGMEIICWPVTWPLRLTVKRGTICADVLVLISTWSLPLKVNSPACALSVTTSAPIKPEEFTVIEPETFNWPSGSMESSAAIWSVTPLLTSMRKAPTRFRWPRSDSVPVPWMTM